MTLSLILLVAAFILFLLATFNVGSPRFSLISAGLACWVLSLLIGGVHLG